MWKAISIANLEVDWSQRYRSWSTAFAYTQGFRWDDSFLRQIRHTKSPNWGHNQRSSGNYLNFISNANKYLTVCYILKRNTCHFHQPSKKINRLNIRILNVCCTLYTNWASKTLNILPRNWKNSNHVRYVALKGK